MCHYCYCYCCSVSEVVSFWVSHSALKLEAILLPQLPEHLDYNCASALYSRCWIINCTTMPGFLIYLFVLKGFAM